MAVYKVIQDVEAEDKLVAFLGLRQFIYIMAAGFIAFIDFQLLTSSGPFTVRIAIAFLLFLPAAVMVLLALPIGGSQPTEDWVLARLNFYLNNQKRIWNQSGVKDLVTITVPKKVENPLTKNLTQHEVRSRLNALASTLDSRGWAVKNVNVNLYSQPGYFTSQDPSSDRLVAASSLPQSVPTIEVRAEDDIMDENSSAVAQHFEKLMEKQEVEHKESVNQQLEQARQQTGPFDEEPKDAKPDYWFMSDPLPKESRSKLPVSLPSFKPLDPDQARFEHSHSITPGLDQDDAQSYKKTEDEDTFLKQLSDRREKDYHRGANSHLRTINPLHGPGAHQHVTDDSDSQTQTAQTDDQQVTEAGKTAIVKLANESDSLRVSTVASLAKHQLEQKNDNGEVEIRLH